jgi:hypothetical protein
MGVSGSGGVEASARVADENAPSPPQQQGVAAAAASAPAPETAAVAAPESADAPAESVAAPPLDSAAAPADSLVEALAVPADEEALEPQPMDTAGTVLER